VSKYTDFISDLRLRMLQANSNWEVPSTIEIDEDELLILINLLDDYEDLEFRMEGLEK